MSQFARASELSVRMTVSETLDPTESPPWLASHLPFRGMESPLRRFP